MDDIKEEIKIGSVIVGGPLLAAPRELLSVLVTLAKGWIFPPSEWFEERGIKGFLPEFIFLPDTLLHHERIILPASVPYGDLIDASIIKDLMRKKILCREPTYRESAYPVLWDIDEIDGYVSKLKDFSAIDRRTRLLNIIMDSDSYKDWLWKHGITIKESTTQPQSLAKQVYDAFQKDPINTGGLTDPSTMGLAMTLSSKISVIEPSHYLASSRYLNTLSQQYIEEFSKSIFLTGVECNKSAFCLVSEELESARKSINDNLFKKGGMISRSTHYEIPFGLALILKDVTHPTDFFDTMLEKRKDGAVRKFRTWLRKYDEALKSGNLGQIAKAQAETEFAAQQLREEFTTFNMNEHISSYSEITSTVIDLLTGQSPEVLIKKLPSLLEGRISKWRYPHLYYMQELGRAGIDISVREELKRVFGEEGEKFADYLNYQYKQMEIIREIENLPRSPWYEPKPIITITYPKDGSEVSLCTLIKGTSNIISESFGHFSPLLIYEYIYSCTNNKWIFNRLPPAIIYPNGDWKAFCAFKTLSPSGCMYDSYSNEQHFKICAIITMKRLDSNCFYMSYDSDELPDDIVISKSPPISVTRKENGYDIKKMEELYKRFYSEFADWWM